MMVPSVFLEACREAIGAAHVITGPNQVSPFFTDWSGRWRGDGLAVLQPGSTEEVAKVMRLCCVAGIAVVPQGGNTGLSGGAAPRGPGPSVVMHLGRLQVVGEVDAINNTLTVGAGVTLARVQEIARASNRIFPLSLASEGSCTIGGNLATNAGGTAVLRYGSMRQLCLGIEVVLPDGSIWNGLRSLRKDNSGYSLRDLYIGSEGTLGLITAAVLQLHARPTDVVTAMLMLDHPERAVACFEQLRAALDAALTTFELMSPTSLDTVAEHLPGLSMPWRHPHPWMVLVECTGTLDPPREDGERSAELLLRRVEGCLAQALDAGLICDVVIAQSTAQARSLWAIREGVPIAQSRDRVALRYDLSFPISALDRFLHEAGQRIAAIDPGLVPVAFGHVGDGNLHFNVGPGSCLVESSEEKRARVDAAVYELVRELGGSISAEHGIGQAKMGPWGESKSAVEVGLMQTLKNALDPRRLMNPGVLFSATEEILSPSKP